MDISIFVGKIYGPEAAHANDVISTVLHHVQHEPTLARLHLSVAYPACHVITYTPAFLFGKEVEEVLHGSEV